MLTRSIKTVWRGLIDVHQKLMAVTMMILFLGVSSIYAATDDPFASAAQTIQGYGSSVQKLIYALAAVISLVGAFNIFHKMSNGDQDTKKAIMLYMGGAIALLGLAAAMPAMFGHSF